MSTKSNPEQSAEPAKKRPRITSDESDDSSLLHSDGGDEMVHQSGDDDGKQSNESAAKEDHAKGEKVDSQAKAGNNDEGAIGSNAAGQDIIREGKKSILFWVHAYNQSDSNDAIDQSGSDDANDQSDSDDDKERDEEPNPPPSDHFSLVESMNHSFSSKVSCGEDEDGPTFILSEKGELLMLVEDEDEPEEVVKALCGKVIVDFVRNADKVAVLTDEGTVYLWEYTLTAYYDKHMYERSLLVDTLSDHVITQVALGCERRLYAVTSTGSLYTLLTENDMNPSVLDGLESKQVRMVVANEVIAICVTTDEDVYAWFHFRRNDELSSPKRVEGLDGDKVKLVACGSNGNGIICTDDCKVHTFDIATGELLGKRHEKRIEQVLEGKDIIQIKSGSKHTSALTSSGYVYTWGNHGGAGFQDTSSVRASTPCILEKLREYNVVHILDIFEMLNERARMVVAIIDSTSATSRAELDKRELLNNEQHSDIVFMVEGQPIYAKKDILVARSEYFRAMFSSNMRESREGEIEITCCSRATFVVLLEYLYTDVLTLTDKFDLFEDDCHALLELYVMADMYQMDGMMILCETTLESHLCVKNALNVLQQIEKIDTAVCDPLKEICLDLIDKKKWHDKLDLSESACSWKESVSKMSLLLEIEKRYHHLVVKDHKLEVKGRLEEIEYFERKLGISIKKY